LAGAKVDLPINNEVTQPSLDLFLIVIEIISVPGQTDSAFCQQPFDLE
jgi:hypothetical protein